MTPKRVLIIGAAGNLGRRLLQAGHRQGHITTALVRDEKVLRIRLKGDVLEKTRVIEGDVLDAHRLEEALDGQDIVINAAGNVNDGAPFSDLFDRIVSTIERHPAIEMSWFLGGAAVLDVPNTRRIGVGLPFVPTVYQPHRVNWQRLKRSTLDWSMMCPGPMTAAERGVQRSDLRISIDSMPYRVGTWARFAPPLALSLVMKSKLPELIVPYEDVAAIIMSNVEAGGQFSRHRVGVALPAGERSVKKDWTLGNRGPDA